MDQGLHTATCIINACIVMPDHVLSNGTLVIRDGLVAEVHCAGDRQAEELIQSSDTQLFDLDGDIVIPGLIDLHVHGCGGGDTMDADPAAMATMASALLKHGTTAYLATTMTDTPTRLLEVLAVRPDFHPNGSQSELLGFHMEGPCVSTAYRGAQNKILVPSDVHWPIPGNVRIITLAPELPESRAYIAWGNSIGAIISAGHSGATYEEMQDAIKLGVNYVTHAFNAMPGIHHRCPGLLTAALLDPGVTIELIADGVHVHPAVLELALRLKGPEQVVLISDGTRAVGMPDGEYDLGGQLVRLLHGKMTLPDGTIAGSAKPLLAGVRFMARVVGRPLHEAVRMATMNPARLLNIGDRLGSLEKGREATFLRLSPDLILKETWIRGSNTGQAQL